MVEFHKKICFTGAQGTGKTTILQEMKDMDYPVITEVVRKLRKSHGISINTNGNNDSQTLIFQTYLKAFQESEGFVSDRGLTDVLAYTMDGVRDGSVGLELMEEQMKTLHDFTQSHPEVAYVYFPIEFPVVDDGVRSLDEEYRARISENIRIILETLHIPYLEVHGSPRERLDQIMEWMWERK